MTNIMAKRIPIREGLFTEGPDGGRLLANKCKSCGQVFFPKVAFCFSCLKENMEDIILSRQGKLFTYTIAHMATMHFKPPYSVGYIEMPEGLRIFSPLKMVESKPFKIDMDMELSIEELWQEDDKHIIGYKFKPL